MVKLNSSADTCACLEAANVILYINEEYCRPTSACDLLFTLLTLTLKMNDRVSAMAKCNF